MVNTVDITTVGIDPGLSGVISIRQTPTSVLTFPNPFTMYKDMYARPVIDVEQWIVIQNAIWESADKGRKGVFILIESPAIHGGHDSNVAVAGIHWYGGAIDTAFRLALNVAPQIEYVRPQQWQAQIIYPFIEARGYPFPKGGKDARARWKQLSIEYVREKYGPESLKFSRGRKENDNIADSICISEYAQMIVEGKVAFKRAWIYTPRKGWQNKRPKAIGDSHE